MATNLYLIFTILQHPAHQIADPSFLQEDRDEDEEAEDEEEDENENENEEGAQTGEKKKKQKPLSSME